MRSNLASIVINVRSVQIGSQFVGVRSNLGFIVNNITAVDHCRSVRNLWEMRSNLGSTVINVRSFRLIRNMWETRNNLGSIAINIMSIQAVSQFVRDAEQSRVYCYQHYSRSIQVGLQNCGRCGAIRGILLSI